MALLRVLAFDHDGRPVQFDTWLNDLQLYLLSDSKDSVSLFDLESCAATTPPATADSVTRSQWLTHHAAACLAIRNHLPLAECAHFVQHRTAQALNNAVLARYSSPATAALGRLLLPYLFPELSAFATVEDLVSHLRASDAHYRVAAPAEYHFLSLDPTSLTIDLLEQHLLVAETSAVAVGAARGTPRPPFFEGCSPSPLAPSYASTGAVDILGTQDVGAASASAKRCSSKGKGGRGGGGGSGGGGGGCRSSGRGSSGGGGSGGTCGALSVSAEGDCYRCVPPNPGIAAAALGASESGTLLGTTPAEALHTFTLDSGASRCFFRDRTTLTPLPAPVPVRLADPSGGPVVARSSTVLPCPVVRSGSLPGLHLPLFSINLVSAAALYDAMVTTTTLGGQRVSICTCTRTGRHMATFTCRPGSSLYTFVTEPSQTLLWHRRLGHPSLPRLRGMHSRLLVSGLPKSLPHIHPSPAPPCLPCVEGRQRAAPHSSFPPMIAPLQTLQMEVWGPARFTGQGRERYFPLVVDDYSRYTMVFPLRSKGQVVDVLIPWIRAIRLRLRERFRADLPVLHLHSDRGGEFSSDLLRDLCRGEGILQSFTLPDSPQQNGIAERRIGLVMELNLWPRVSLPEISPTLRWTGKVGDASVFRVWGSRAFARNPSTDKLSTRAIPCDVTFDESVPFYRLFPYRSAPLPPPPLFLAPDPPPGAVPSEVAVDSGATRGTASRGALLGGAGHGGAEPGGAETRGAEPGGVETGGAKPVAAKPEGVGPGGAASEGAESGVAEPQGAASSGGSAGASSRLPPQQLREWFVRRARLRSGAAGAGGAGVATGAGVTGGTAATCPGGARTRGTGAAGTGGVGGAGAGDTTKSGAAGAGGSGAGGARAGGAAVGGTNAGGTGVGGTSAGGAGAGGAGAVDPGDRDHTSFPCFSRFLPASPLPAPSPYTKQSVGLTERHEPASRLVLPVGTARRVPRLPPPPVPGTHAMTLRPSSVPLRVPLPAPPESSLPTVPDPESHLLLCCFVSLVAELLDFGAACRLDYASALVGESASASHPSVEGECALGTDVLEDRQEDFECLAAAVPRFASMLLAPKGDPDAPDIPTPRSYAEAFTALLRVALSGLQYNFPTRQPARGDLTASPTWLHWVVSYRTTLAALGFAPCTSNPSLFLRTDTLLPPFYVLVCVDDLVFATSDNEALTLVKSELQKRHTCTDLGELCSYLGLQITQDRAWRTITLTQSHMVHQVLQRFGFQFSSPQPTPLSTGHSLSAPPSDESVEPSGPYPELVGCLMYLMTCTRPDLVYPLSLLARYVAPVRHRKRSSQGYTFSLGSDSVSWRSTHSSSVLSSSCEAEIYAGAMAAQELRWLIYLVTDLGEQPRSPPFLYVDNKAMITLCHEHRLEHRTKHIALRYFLARELQQRGQLRLAYVATRANTADIFTKALPPGDHQRFSIVLGLVPSLPHLLTALLFL
ncbi:unnamed protein product [Closterium sp. NIES-53]